MSDELSFAFYWPVGIAAAESSPAVSKSLSKSLEQSLEQRRGLGSSWLMLKLMLEAGLA